MTTAPLKIVDGGGVPVRPSHLSLVDTFPRALSTHAVLGAGPGVAGCDDPAVPAAPRRLVAQAADEASQAWGSAPGPIVLRPGGLLSFRARDLALVARRQCRPVLLPPTGLAEFSMQGVPAPPAAAVAGRRGRGAHPFRDVVRSHRAGLPAPGLVGTQGISVPRSRRVPATDPNVPSPVTGRPSCPTFTGGGELPVRSLAPAGSRPLTHGVPQPHGCEWPRLARRRTRGCAVTCGGPCHGTGPGGFPDVGLSGAAAGRSAPVRLQRRAPRHRSIRGSVRCKRPGRPTP